MVFLRITASFLLHAVRLPRATAEMEALIIIGSDQPV